MRTKNRNGKTSYVKMEREKKEKRGERKEGRKRRGEDLITVNYPAKFGGLFYLQFFTRVA